MQLSLRKRFSDGYQFDLNYTLGYASDHGSLLEGDETFQDFDNGGYTGFLLDTWNPDKQYGRADFDVRHLINLNWIAEVPVGRGRRFGSDMPAVLDAIVGDWSTGRHRPLEQRVPVQRLQLPPVLVHQLEPAGQRRADRPERRARDPHHARPGDGYPSPFADVDDALTKFRRACPGEVGVRNELAATATSRSTSASARASTCLRRPQAALPLGHVQRHQHAEVRRVLLDMFPDRSRLRPLLQHPRRPATAGRAVHAVRVAVRVLTENRDAGGVALRQPRFLLPLH